MNALPKAVFAERPTESVSEKYSFISSKQIVDKFLSSGFEIAKSGGVKGRVDPEHAKHFITFTNPKVPNLIDPRINNGVGTPEVLVINSSDGKSAVQFALGIYAFICGNGLVVGTQYSGKRFKHMNLSYNDIEAVISEFISSPQKLQDDIYRFASRQLTQEEMQKIAAYSLISKYGSVKGNVLSVLERRREADLGNDAWTVFNVIQENLVKGGYKLERRTVRQMAAHRAINLTQKVWDIFEEEVFTGKTINV
jgi:hypothetical protein